LRSTGANIGLFFLLTNIIFTIFTSFF